MAVVPVPCMRVQAVFTVSASELATNTWHLERPANGNVDQARVDSICTAFRDFYTQWTPMGSPAAELASFSVFDTGGVAQAPGGGFDWGHQWTSVQAPNIKGQNGSALPPQLAPVLTLESGQAGRRGRGRIYLPPISTATLMQDGRLSQTRVDALLAAAVTLRNTLSAQGNALAVLSRVAPGALYHVTGFTMDTVADTQRRRRSAFRGPRTRSTG